MNVYDFDGTIYDGDSTIDFYLFCVMKKPSVLFSIPKQLNAVIKYKLGKITKTKMKSLFFSFLERLEDVGVLISDFWKRKKKKIKEFYYVKHLSL